MFHLKVGDVSNLLISSTRSIQDQCYSKFTPNIYKDSPKISLNIKGIGKTNTMKVMVPKEDGG